MRPRWRENKPRGKEVFHCILFFFLIESHAFFPITKSHVIFPITKLNFHKSLRLGTLPTAELMWSWLSRQVKSKTVAQCVEYYYTWKKIMRLGRKHRTRLAEIDDSVVSEAASVRPAPTLHPG